MTQYIWCQSDLLGGVTGLMQSSVFNVPNADLPKAFHVLFWIKVWDMDNSREQVIFKSLRPTVTPPTSQAAPLGQDDAPVTPCGWNMVTDKDPNASPLSYSPGTDGLGALSLDTPKRKAQLLSVNPPSSGEVELRKRSRKMLETFQVNLRCKSFSEYKTTGREQTYKEGLSCNL